MAEGKIFSIHIPTTADTQGIEQVTQGLGGVEAQVKAVTTATEQMGEAQSSAASKVTKAVEMERTEKERLEEYEKANYERHMARLQGEDRAEEEMEQKRAARAQKRREDAEATALAERQAYDEGRQAGPPTSARQPPPLPGQQPLPGDPPEPPNPQPKQPGARGGNPFAAGAGPARFAHRALMGGGENEALLALSEGMTALGASFTTILGVMGGVIAGFAAYKEGMKDLIEDTPHLKEAFDNLSKTAHEALKPAFEMLVGKGSDLLSGTNALTIAFGGETEAMGHLHMALADYVPLADHVLTQQEKFGQVLRDNARDAKNLASDLKYDNDIADETRKQELYAADKKYEETMRGLGFNPDSGGSYSGGGGTYASPTLAGHGGGSIVGHPGYGVASPSGGRIAGDASITGGAATTSSPLASGAYVQSDAERKAAKAEFEKAETHRRVETEEREKVLKDAQAKVAAAEKLAAETADEIRYHDQRAKDLDALSKARARVVTATANYNTVNNSDELTYQALKSNALPAPLRLLLTAAVAADKLLGTDLVPKTSTKEEQDDASQKLTRANLILDTAQKHGVIGGSTDGDAKQEIKIREELEKKKREEGKDVDDAKRDLTKAENLVALKNRGAAVKTADENKSKGFDKVVADIEAQRVAAMWEDEVADDDKIKDATDKADKSGKKLQDIKDQFKDGKSVHPLGIATPLPPVLPPEPPPPNPADLAVPYAMWKGHPKMTHFHGPGHEWANNGKNSTPTNQLADNNPNSASNANEMANQMAQALRDNPQRHHRTSVDTSFSPPGPPPPEPATADMREEAYRQHQKDLADAARAKAAKEKPFKQHAIDKAKHDHDEAESKRYADAKSVRDHKAVNDEAARAKKIMDDEAARKKRIADREQYRKDLILDPDHAINPDDPANAPTASAATPATSHATPGRAGGGETLPVLKQIEINTRGGSGGGGGSSGGGGGGSAAGKPAMEADGKATTSGGAQAAPAPGALDPAQKPAKADDSTKGKLTKFASDRLDYDLKKAGGDKDAAEKAQVAFDDRMNRLDEVAKDHDNPHKTPHGLEAHTKTAMSGKETDMSKGTYALNETTHLIHTAKTDAEKAKMARIAMMDADAKAHGTVRSVGHRMDDPEGLHGDKGAYKAGGRGGIGGYGMHGATNPNPADEYGINQNKNHGDLSPEKHAEIVGAKIGESLKHRDHPLAQMVGHFEKAAGAFNTLHTHAKASAGRHRPWEDNLA